MHRIVNRSYARVRDARRWLAKALEGLAPAAPRSKDRRSPVLDPEWFRFPPF